MNIHFVVILSPVAGGGTEAIAAGTSTSTTGGRDKVMVGSSVGGAGLGGGGARGSTRGSLTGGSEVKTASSTQ